VNELKAKVGNETDAGPHKSYWAGAASAARFRLRKRDGATSTGGGITEKPSAGWLPKGTGAVVEINFMAGCCPSSKHLQSLGNVNARKR